MSSMLLPDWVAKEGNGAITTIQLRSGLGYATVHNIVSGKTKRPRLQTAARIAAATGYQVRIEDLRPQTGT